MYNPRHSRSPRNLLLGRAIPRWASADGIFVHLDEDNEMPWSTSTQVTALGLDIAYEGQHSNQKFVAPLFYNWLDADGELTSTGMDSLCAALKAKYLQKWKHLWDLYSSTYGPLDTLAVRETGSRQSTKAGTGTDTMSIDDETTRNLTRSGTNNETLTIDDESGRNATISGTNSNTRTDNLTEQSSGTDGTINSGTDTTTSTYGQTRRTDNTGTEMNEHRVSGFNSSTPVNATQDQRTPTLTENVTNGGQDTSALQHGLTQNRTLQSTTTNTGTESNSGTDSRTEAETTTNDGTHTTAGRTSQTDAETLGTAGTHTTEKENEETYSESYTNTRTGTFRYAPAELMEMDRAFWLDGYFNIIFDDLDDFLCLRIYPERIPNTYIFS